MAEQTVGKARERVLQWFAGSSMRQPVKDVKALEDAIRAEALREREAELEKANANIEVMRKTIDRRTRWLREREAEVERLREALLAYSPALSEALSALSFVRAGGSPPPDTLRLLDAHLRSEAFVAAVQLVREFDGVEQVPGAGADDE